MRVIFRTDAGLFPHPNPLPQTGRGGLTESFFDVVISLEAARWLYFLCQINVTIKFQKYDLSLKSSIFRFPKL